MTKRIFTYICCIVSLLYASAAYAQPYGNEWISYGNTYHKFKVGIEGIYRISRATLDAAGVPASTTGAQFALYRDGQPVPIHVTTSGALSSGDYIEFYGLKANGSLDRLLYANPLWMPNDRISLFTDSAAYFLTYDNNPHTQYTAITTPIPPTPPPAIPFCLATVGIDYKNKQLQGSTYISDQGFFSSQFDIGEGYVLLDYILTAATTVSLSTPNIVAGAPALLTTTVLGATRQTSIPQQMFIKLNGQQIADSQLTFSPTRKADTKRFILPISSNQLSANNNIEYSFNPAGTLGDYTAYGTTFAAIQYPRNFDVSGLNFFSCKLNAGTGFQYVVFNNFNHGGSAPRLYDVTNKKYYTGDISTSGQTRFYLDPSLTERTLVLFSNTSSAIRNTTPVRNFQFTNYTAAANQGNYIIITHKGLEQSSGGQNGIQDYRTYRSSAQGGSYTVVVADVLDLYDQFAFGIDIHPLSVRRFLQYAYDKWNSNPEHVFLIGRGILYHKYAAYLAAPGTYTAPIVPTYGDPGSDVDFVNFGTDGTQKISIGRLSAWNGQEVVNYLEKVKAYEQALQPSVSPSYATDLWKKQVLHIAGGDNVPLQTQLLSTLNAGKSIIAAPNAGASVNTVAKNTTSPVDLNGSKFVDSMFNQGLSFLTFHGHAFSSGFDFNLNNPEQYTNKPRFPVFLGLGCDVAQIYELTTQRTISERYVNATNGGSIAMIAQNNLGYLGFHNTYLRSLYSDISRIDYGGTIGHHTQYAYDSCYAAYASLPGFSQIFVQLESMILQGDPAIRLLNNPKPDFHVSADGLSTTPANITVDNDSFRLRIISFNLGKAINDTVFVQVTHTNPLGNTTTITTYALTDLFSIDTTSISVPIHKTNDLGLNKYTVTIDATARHDEASESNNTATLNAFIYGDNLVPVYPYEFSIVGQQGITLKASSLNPFRTLGRYKLEMDTTELFNSPLKQQTTINSAGGVIKWTPAMSYMDSTVYYWRTAFDSAVNGLYQWSTSSFLFLPGNRGWNQSHYYQYLKNNFNTLTLGSNRQFEFPVTNNTLKVTNAILDDPNTLGHTTVDVDVTLNDVSRQRSGCPPFPGTLQVFVFDGATANMWNNAPTGTGGAYAWCFNTRNQHCFEFPLNTLIDRNNASTFLNNIPNGNYVLIRNFHYEPYSQYVFANAWQDDTLVNGSGVSLYHTIRNLGFSQIDSFNYPRAFIMLRKKGDASYPVYQDFTAGRTDVLNKTYTLPALAKSGIMTSRTVGPAAAWDRLLWATTAADGLPQNDSSSVRITGITNAGTETVVYDGNSTNLNLNFISATTYPRLRLEWLAYDSVNRSAPQLAYWRVLHTPVPEAALNPSLQFTFTDSIATGQIAGFSTAIENISDLPMDSMLVRYRLIDANGVTHNLADRRYKPLPVGDTLHASFSFDGKTYPGSNVFFIEANPDNDQPEHYHPNNLGYLPLKVDRDLANPLIDVTFDGVHILDRDIVSAKPYIKITLKDENLFQALNDTSLLRLYVRYPEDGPSVRRQVPLDGALAKFTPGQSGQRKNEAIIEYRPTYLQDGIYELFVNGADKAGNVAGINEYRISFEVINKPTITNVLNYPNPFSTATSFLFTVTGSQVPSQLKIQILTVTGKVVREITKGELGALHIGRNITQYKWDGKDQYGQTLGNGVYLYRVVTSLNGNGIEHRESGADKFFKNGYGKMYIMR